MGDNMVIKSRRERRSEARHAKLQQRLHTWVIHQAGKRRRAQKAAAQAQSASEDSSPLSTSPNSNGLIQEKNSTVVPPLASGLRNKNVRISEPDKAVVKERRGKTKFEEFLDRDMEKTAHVSPEYDLALERKLAKRLKVKGGRLGDFGDGMADVLDGLDEGATYELNQKVAAFTGIRKDAKNKECKASVSDQETLISSNNLPVDFIGNSSSSLHAKNTEIGAVKYVPPHFREKASNESEEMVRIQRCLRGLLNRLSEANLEPIASDVSLLFQAHGRRMVTELVTSEIIGACCGGPRGNDQYAAVFAAYVAGTAALVGIDFGAKFSSSLASSFEEHYAKEDSLALRNLALLFANLYLFNLLPSEVVYEVLAMLCKRFQELDVATILTLLQSCGMGLRAADPASMKEFIVSVRQRTADLKASLSSTNSGKPVGLGKRVQFMLDMICDIKNNKRRTKEDPTHHTRLKKWLQKVGVEDVQLRSVTWAKLIDPEKKGQWWLPGLPSGGGENLAGARAELAGVLDGGAAEADRMLQLAASQRMNTDARRAIFCIVMSAEDYVDAYEKIMRLKLPAKQDREVVRVIVECCLQGQAYNKYFAFLLIKLCRHEKNHKFSFQYCLWDHLKQLNTMELRRSTNLARLTAALIGSFSLSLSVIKVVDFLDIQKLTCKVVFHFRIMFEHLLTEHDDDIVWGVFSRIASTSELVTLRDGLAIFLHQQFSRQQDPEKNILLNKYKLAKKALANVAGVPHGTLK